MPSEKFRITTNGQSLRNPNNGFFDITLSANMTLDTSDVSANNDRRSAHNALERQRREHLNNKFQQLALALPALQTVRRPSKTMIVAKSLEFVSSSLQRENKFVSEIQKLRKENEKLRKQAASSSLSLKNKQQAKKTEKEASLKRKASSESQLSPPPTPEALRIESKRSHTPETDKEETGPSPQKKRMIQQQKSPKSESSVTSQDQSYQSTAHIVDSHQWSSFDASLCQPINSLMPLTNNVYTDAYSPANNDMMFMSPNCAAPSVYDNCDPLAMQTSMPSSYNNNMVNPTLFSPYYFQQEPNALNYSFEQKSNNFFMS